MNAKEILERLKVSFNELVKNADASGTMEAPSSASKPIDATLKDGTKIQITSLEVGGIVTINGTPAPTGEHELSDGTKIVVGDNGAITDLKVYEKPEEEEVEVEDMGAKFSAFESATNEKFASYEQKFQDYETRFANYESRLDTATKVISDLMKLSQILSEQPTGTPDSAVKPTASFNETKSLDILFNK
jgi:hypothetical protein